MVQWVLANSCFGRPAELPIPPVGLMLVCLCHDQSAILVPTQMRLSRQYGECCLCVEYIRVECHLAAFKDETYLMRDDELPAFASKNGSQTMSDRSATKKLI
jgi:hypothetical protein